MYLWKKTEDYQAFRKYEIAKQHLSDLLVINPHDPNKNLLPRLTLEQASEMQRLAMSQRNPQAIADILTKAVKLYNLALDEGLKDEMVFSLIKQCENVLEKNKYSNIKQPTTYGINFDKEKETKAEQINCLHLCWDHLRELSYASYFEFCPSLNPGEG